MKIAFVNMLAIFQAYPNNKDCVSKIKKKEKYT